MEVYTSIFLICVTPILNKFNQYCNKFGGFSF